MRETKLGWLASSTLKPHEKHEQQHGQGPQRGVRCACQRTHRQQPQLGHQDQADGPSRAARKRPRRSRENKPPMATKDNTTAGKYSFQCASWPARPTPAARARPPTSPSARCAAGTPRRSGAADQGGATADAIATRCLARCARLGRYHPQHHGNARQRECKGEAEQCRAARPRPREQRARPGPAQTSDRC